MNKILIAIALFLGMGKAGSGQIKDSLNTDNWNYLILNMIAWLRKGAIAEEF